MTSGTRPNNRERILDTALTLMSTHGASATSMRRLADACGLNVAAIYHYFPSKEALLATVIEERRYGARISEIPELDASAPPAERLRAIFDEMWSGALAEQQVWRLLLGEGLRSDAAALPVGSGLLDVFAEGLTAWITSTVHEVDEPAAVAQLMIGQLFAGFIRHIFEPTTDTDSIRDDGVAALLTALAI